MGETPFDAEREMLRARLTLSSPVLQAQSLVHRERMTQIMTAAVARRLNVVPVENPTPYLAATVWIATLEFYRRRAVLNTRSNSGAVKAIDEVLDEVLDILRPLWPDLDRFQ